MKTFYKYFLPVESFGGDNGFIGRTNPPGVQRCATWHRRQQDRNETSGDFTLPMENILCLSSSSLLNCRRKKRVRVYTKRIITKKECMRKTTHSHRWQMYEFNVTLKIIAPNVHVAQMCLFLFESNDLEYVLIWSVKRFLMLMLKYSIYHC